MANDSSVKVRVLGDSKDGQRAMREYAQSVLEAEKTTEQFGKKLDNIGKSSLKVLGALPAVGMAAGLGVVAGLAAIPVALGAVAAFALSSNEEVKQSFGDLWDEIKVTAQDAAAPLTGTFVNIAKDLRTTVQGIKPDLQNMFSYAAPGLRELGSGVSDFVKNIMPGMKVAVQNSYEPLKGLRSLLADTGTGFSDFFKNISGGSGSAGTVLVELGRVIKEVLGFAGSLLAKISNAFEGNFSQISEIVGRASKALSSFADGALPVLASAATAALNVVTALLKALEPFSGVLGVVAGSMIATAAAGKAMALAMAGVSAVTGIFSASGGLAKGLTSLGSKVENVALKGAVLAEAFTGSSRAGMGLVNTGTAVSGSLSAVGAVLPALGAGLAVAGILAGTYMIQQQNLKEGADALSTSLAKGGTEAKNAAEQMANHKRELAEATKVNQAWTDSQDNMSDSAVAASNVLYEKQQVVNAEAESWKSMLATMTPVEQKQAEYNRAVAEYGPSSTQAATAAGVWRAEIDKTTASQKLAADAIKTTTEKMIEQYNQQMMMVSADLAYRNSVNATSDAQRAAVDAINTHGAASEEAADASRALEGAQLSQIVSSGNLAAANATGASEQEKSRLATIAMINETFNLAAANNGALSPALMQSISNLNSTQLAAAGLTVKVNETGQAVVSLPNGKTITLAANDYLNTPLQSAVNTLSQIQSKTITLTVNEIRIAKEYSASVGGVSGRAVGGPISANTPYLVGEVGPEFVFPSKSGYVATAAETDRLFNQLATLSGIGEFSVPQQEMAKVNSSVNMVNQQESKNMSVTFGDIIVKVDNPMPNADNIANDVAYRVMDKITRYQTLNG